MQDSVPVLISAEQIQQRVRELGARITTDFTGEPLTVIVILHGALVFAADLIRSVDLPLTLDVIKVSSYDGTNSTGTISRMLGPSHSVTDRHVILIDDILDTGLTLSTIRFQLMQQGAASLQTCVLLEKPSRRLHSIAAAYTGFTIENHFVVGYGLDYDGRYRNLPYIGTLPDDLK